MKRIVFLLLAAALAGGATAREFTGKNGKKIDAEIVSRTATHVELKLTDGKTVKVAINSLSGADQLYVKTWEDPVEKAERLKTVDLADLLAAKGYIPMPMQASDGQLIAQVTIDGKTGAFLVDSGAQVPLIKQASLEKFGLTMKPVQAQGQGGGNAVIGTVQPKTLGNESVSFAPPECYVLTMEHLPKAIIDKIDGVIGGQFFVDHGAVLDYTGQKLWLKE
jgi:hypothetical protein